jgi:Ca2+-binding EF-hand superfamily protein
LDTWFTGLIDVIKAAKMQDSDRAYLMRYFPKKKALSHSQVEDLLYKMNFSASSSFIKQKIKEVDSDGNKKLDFGEFIELIHVLRHRQYFDHLFDKYSTNKTYLTEEELLTFLYTEQKVCFCNSILTT